MRSCSSPGAACRGYRMPEAHPKAGHTTTSHRVCSGQEETVLVRRRAPSRTGTKWAILLLLLPARQPSTGGATHRDGGQLGLKVRGWPEGKERSTIPG